nr:hypothetical protein [Tanacetum cinerariifolium]
MFEDKSYKAYEYHKKSYDALEKSLEHAYSDQLLSNLEEALQKKRKRRDVRRTPFGSPPPQPPPLPPPAGASGGLGISGASGSSYFSPQSMAWTTSDIRYKSDGLSETQELSPIDSLIPDDSIHNEQRYDKFPELVLPTSEQDVLTPVELKGQAYEVVKAFYPDFIHMQFQMEECHKMLTDQVDTNPEGDQVRINVNRPLPLGGTLGHVTIQTQFFFNKDLEYLRYGNKGYSPALSISKMKAVSYPDFGLELLVQNQVWIDNVCTYDISVKYGAFYCCQAMDSKLSDQQRVGIESYQTQLNLIKPGWDATGYEFEHDYTIIKSP